MEGVRGAMAEVGGAVEEAVQGGVHEAVKEVLEMGALLRSEMRAAEEAAQRALAAERDARRASATEALAAVDELRAWTEAEVARQAGSSTCACACARACTCACACKTCACACDPSRGREPMCPAWRLDEPRRRGPRPSWWRAWAGS